MAEMNKGYPVRRLRISGKPDEVRGYMLEVHAEDTGETITNIRRIVVTLDAREINRAEVTYLVFPPGQAPVDETAIIDNPVIDATAIEELRD